MKGIMDEITQQNGPRYHYSWLVQEDWGGCWHGRRARWPAGSSKKPIGFALVGQTGSCFMGNVQCCGGLLLLELKWKWQWGLWSLHCQEGCLSSSRSQAWGAHEVILNWSVLYEGTMFCQGVWFGFFLGKCQDSLLPTEGILTWLTKSRLERGLLGLEGVK